MSWARLAFAQAVFVGDLERRGRPRKLFVEAALASCARACLTRNEMQGATFSIELAPKPPIRRDVSSTWRIMRGLRLPRKKPRDRSAGVEQGLWLC